MSDTLSVVSESGTPSIGIELTNSILLSKPMCDFLQLSAYTPSITETIPIILLKQEVTNITSAA